MRAGGRTRGGWSDVTEKPANGAVGLAPELAVSLYRTMRLIRRFEETCVSLVNDNEIAAVVHESIGQEAVAAGVTAALGPQDYLTSTHRGHGHILGRGADPRRVMAELMGRTTGTNRGRGGSMHVGAPDLGILGANGIVAAGTPIAVGATWAARTTGGDTVCAAFFGDGAINQGVLHEAMNLAVIWNVPVVFCCENNLYAVTTSLEGMTGSPIPERAGGVGMPVSTVDGMDPGAVHDAMVEAIARGRRDGIPSFIEFRTYRYSGHHTAEAATGVDYRSDAEMEAWRRKDPLLTWPERLGAQGILTAAGKQAIDAEIEDLVAESVAFARNSPWPEPIAVLDLVYASGAEGGFPATTWGGS